MRDHLFAAALLALFGTVQAQELADAEERARIGAERTRAEADFAAAEKACYAKFAVNDCIGEARSRLRATLSDLRRQEVSLNDAERRRRAADRLREIEARQARQPVPPKSQAQAPQPEPPSGSREPAAASSAPAPVAVEAAPREAKTPADPQGNARRQQQRIDEARAHKEEVLKRAAERTQPVRPLPVPP